VSPRRLLMRPLLNGGTLGGLMAGATDVTTTGAARDQNFRLWGAAVGVLVGLVLFACVRYFHFPQSAVPGKDHLGSLVAPLAFVLLGTGRLFRRAAFPDRIFETGPERLRQAVMAAALVLSGVCWSAGNVLGLWPMLISSLAYFAAVVRLPAQLFRSPTTSPAGGSTNDSASAGGGN
jgi:hypothetical protein